MTPTALPHLAGQTVTVNYTADPKFGHGQFQLDNPTSTVLRASVDAAWLELGERRQTLEHVTLYDLDHETSVNPSGFQVEPQAVMNFLIGFPVIAHEPQFGQFTAVGLRLRMDDFKQEALSPIKFIRRIPYGL